MDLDLLYAQEQGLKTAIQTLRQVERLFIKHQTLAESIDKARLDAEKAKTELSGMREERANLKKRKAEIVGSICDSLSKDASALLPEGKASIRMDEWRVLIGWENSKGEVIPFHSLSGGQRIFFEAAFTNAMLRGKNRVIVMEAAECDEKRLSSILERVAESHPGAQIIVNVWHKPEKVPEGWEVINL